MRTIACISAIFIALPALAEEPAAARVGPTWTVDGTFPVAYFNQLVHPTTLITGGVEAPYQHVLDTPAVGVNLTLLRRVSSMRIGVTGEVMRGLVGGRTSTLTLVGGPAVAVGTQGAVEFLGEAGASSFANVGQALLEGNPKTFESGLLPVIGLRPAIRWAFGEGPYFIVGIEGYVRYHLGTQKLVTVGEFYEKNPDAREERIVGGLQLGGAIRVGLGW